MDTWHQQMNKAPLWHETQWSVVEDPPNGCTSVSRFDTDAEAQTYKHNVGAKHSYILPPMQAQMRKFPTK